VESIECIAGLPATHPTRSATPYISLYRCHARPCTIDCSAGGTVDAGWQRCLDAYLQTIEDRSGSRASRLTYASTLSRFLSTVTDPALVSHTDVLDFLQLPSNSHRNHGQPVSAATKNQRVTIIRSFYAFASSYVVNDMPLFTRALPTLGISRLKPTVAYYTLNTDELKRLVMHRLPPPIRIYGCLCR
jgi:hypothetical protein